MPVAAAVSVVGWEHKGYTQAAAVQAPIDRLTTVRQVEESVRRSAAMLPAHKLGRIEDWGTTA